MLWFSGLESARGGELPLASLPAVLWGLGLEGELGDGEVHAAESHLSAVREGTPAEAQQTALVRRT